MSLRGHTGGGRKRDGERKGCEIQPEKMRAKAGRGNPGPQRKEKPTKEPRRQAKGIHPAKWGERGVEPALAQENKREKKVPHLAPSPHPRPKKNNNKKRRPGEQKKAQRARALGEPREPQKRAGYSPVEKVKTACPKRQSSFSPVGWPTPRTHQWRGSFGPCTR